MDSHFTLVGIRTPSPQMQKTKRRSKIPIASAVILTVIILGCLVCEIFIPKDPTYMDLYNADIAPSSKFLFGTDAMGRDIFSMIWYGGRISLFIGFFAALISTAAAILIGSVSGLAPKWLDGMIMRFTEIFLSIPSLLLVVFIQAILGNHGAISTAFVIGAAGWPSITKVVRAEVKRLRSSEYVIAAKCMGAGYFHILRQHLLPNLISPIMFMVVMNIRTAIISESTLSFMGLGLPPETISWGGMLSLAERSMLSGSWWSIMIPGGFLIATLLCITGIGNYFRTSIEHKQSNL